MNSEDEVVLIRKVLGNRLRLKEWIIITDEQDRKYLIKYGFPVMLSRIFPFIKAFVLKRGIEINANCGEYIGEDK